MEQLELDAAFTTKGIPRISFWNGRVLTAEDLRDEQLANQLGRQQLGQAVGAGVVRGFSVTPGSSSTHVKVWAGLAVNGLGQAIELPVDVDLSLVVPPEPAGGDGLFTVCDPVSSNTPTGTGLYLFVVRPATADVGSTPGVPAFGSGVATECGPKYVVDGLSFRLIGLDAVALATTAGHDTNDITALTGLGTVTEDPRTRNVLAHLLLDTVAWSRRFADPFGVPSSEMSVGTLASLPTSQLLACEVPLAVVTWSFDDIGFIDVWSVRRPPSTEAALSPVQVLGTVRRQLLGRAAYAQFQDHLATVLDELTPLQRQLFRIEDRFRYLPAAGLIPLVRPRRIGFSAAVFGNIVVRGPVTIDPHRVGALLDESFHHAPIDLERGEVVFLYQVLAADGNVDHIVFCTSRMDFLGDELVIDAVFPGGSLVIGQQIEIRGRNFGFADGSARVRFDDQPADPLAGSSDTRLLVLVPRNLAVVSGGTLVTLEVQSNAGSDSVPVVVRLPVQQPVGLLNVAWVSVDPDTVAVGARCTVVYRVTSRVSPDVDVELLLEGTQSVLDVATLQNKANEPIVEPVHMDTDEAITVQVVIDPVPDVANFTLSMGARVVGHEEIAGADTRQFTTGEPTPPSDPAITIVTPPDVDVQPGGGTATLTGSTLALSDGATVDLEFTLAVTQAGTYRVRVEPSSFTPPWLSVLSQPTSGEFPNIPASELVGDGVATREIRVTVARRSAVIPQPSAITLIVNRPGRSDDARVSYQLEGS
jgi:hypothetical protein